MLRGLFMMLSGVMMAVVVLCTSQCGASVDHTISLARSVGNGTTTTAPLCAGSAEDCIIAQQDLDLDFQMPSEISRRVLAVTSGVTPCKLVPKCAGVCKNPNCAGQKSGKYLDKNCATYNRNCPTNS